MAYAEVTAYASGAYVPPIVKICNVTKTAQLDGVYFKNSAGVIPLQAIITSNATSGATTNGVISYNSLLVNNGSTAYTATSTQIVVDSWSGTTRSSGNYYVFHPATGEFMYVVKDSAPTAGGGTLSVIRGCLGTTASTMANDTYLIVMNSLILPAAGAGAAFIFYMDMPEDPKATFTGIATIA
jgi:hypothetical protein